jgi:hypothetical protein
MMPQILDVQPKEVHVLMEFSLTEMMLLKILLDNLTFNADGQNETHHQVDEFLHEKLYPLISAFCEDYDGIKSS